MHSCDRFPLFSCKNTLVFPKIRYQFLIFPKGRHSFCDLLSADHRNICEWARHFIRASYNLPLLAYNRFWLVTAISWISEVSELRRKRPSGKLRDSDMTKCTIISPQSFFYWNILLSDYPALICAGFVWIPKNLASLEEMNLLRRLCRQLPYGASSKKNLKPNFVREMLKAVFT